MTTANQADSILSGNPLEKLAGIEKKRTLRHFNSDLTSYSSDNSTEVIIDISTPRELLDFQAGYLLFDFIATKTAGTGNLLLQDFAASSWIREFRLEDRSGTQIGKSVNYYNGLVRLEYEMKSNNEANSSYLDVLEGAKAGTNATTAETKIQFAHRFLSHIFTSPDYFPNNFLSGLRIIITMEAADNVMTHAAQDATGLEYTISNVSYACDVIELHPQGMMALKSALVGGLNVNYVRTHSRRTSNMTDTQHFKVGVIDGAIKNLQMITVLDSDRNGQAEDYWQKWVLNNLSSYRVFLNNKPLTDKRINIAATRLTEFVLEYVKSQRLNLDQIVYGSDLFVAANRQAIGSRFDRSNNDDVISSLRDEDNNEVEIEVEFSSTGAAATTYFYILTDQQLRIKPNREFQDIAVKPVSALLSTMSS